jgi:predicted negative regulator of RcsB-dependent stress response
MPFIDFQFKWQYRTRKKARKQQQGSYVINSLFRMLSIGEPEGVNNAAEWLAEKVEISEYDV